LCTTQCQPMNADARAPRDAARNRSAADMCEALWGALRQYVTGREFEREIGTLKAWYALISIPALNAQATLVAVGDHEMLQECSRLDYLQHMWPSFHLSHARLCEAFHWLELCMTSLCQYISEPLDTHKLYRILRRATDIRRCTEQAVMCPWFETLAALDVDLYGSLWADIPRMHARLRVAVEHVILILDQIDAIVGARAGWRDNPIGVLPRGHRARPTRARDG
jgi:hypothetical protein